MFTIQGVKFRNLEVAELMLYVVTWLCVCIFLEKRVYIILRRCLTASSTLRRFSRATITASASEGAMRDC